MRVTGPIGWAAANWSMGRRFANSIFATRFGYVAWIEALIFNAGLIIGTITIMFTFSLFDC